MECSVCSDIIGEGEGYYTLAGNGEVVCDGCSAYVEEVFNVKLEYYVQEDGETVYLN